MFHKEVPKRPWNWKSDYGSKRKRLQGIQNRCHYIIQLSTARFPDGADVVFRMKYTKMAATCQASGFFPELLATFRHDRTPGPSKNCNLRKKKNQLFVLEIWLASQRNGQPIRPNCIFIFWLHRTRLFVPVGLPFSPWMRIFRKLFRDSGYKSNIEKRENDRTDVPISHKCSPINLDLTLYARKTYLESKFTDNLRKKNTNKI